MTKMLKHLIIFLSILAIFPQIHAVPSEGTSGIMPNSPLWRIDTLMEDLQLKLTPNSADKAKLKMKFAEERLGEAYIMSLYANEKAVQRTLDRYAREVSNARDFVAQETTTAVSYDEYVETVKHQYMIQNKVKSQKRSIEQIENLIGRLSMPEQSKTGLLIALDNVGKSTDIALAQIELEIIDSTAELDESDVAEIEALASGVISDETLSRLVADWNEMDSLGGKLDGCYQLSIVKDGKVVQTITGLISDNELHAVGSTISTVTPTDECLVQQIYSDDVMDILDAIDNQDFGELLKIGKRYGYGITDVMGMAQDRGIEISAHMN